MKTLYLTALIFLTGTAVALDQPSVQTQQGTFLGTKQQSRLSRPFFAFLGIRYARIPARFEEAEAPLESEEVINATTHGGDCVQSNWGYNSYPISPLEAPFVGLEDCLFMNVYTPSLKPTSPLPVMYFIHGGAYKVGSGSPVLSGPEHLMDKDIVLVTINYRLGPFGFLHVPERGIHGNIGLKDQAMGLLWVQKNIAAFGGDPNSVTIFGESAGAGSVHLQMHSPLTKGLFHRGISESGSIDCFWAIAADGEAREQAARLALWIGCDINSDSFKECLQKKPLEEVLKAYKQVEVSPYEPYIEFKPVIEEEGPNAFLTTKSVQKRSSLPWINGVNAGEGIFIAGLYLMKGDADLKILNNFHKITLPFIANSYKSSHMPLLMADRISHQYLGDKGITNDNLADFIKLMSDYMFIHGHYKSTALHQGPVYQYYLSHKGSKSFDNNTLFSKLNVPDHGEELFYLFSSQKYCTDVTPTADDLEMIDQVVDLFTNFAIHGTPTPPGSKYQWEPKENGDMHFELKPSTKGMIKAPFLDRMPFWDQLTDELVSGTMVKPMSHEEL